MLVVKNDQATLGSWDNRIRSIANYSERAVCYYAAPNYGEYGSSTDGDFRVF